MHKQTARRVTTCLYLAYLLSVATIRINLQCHIKFTTALTTVIN